MNPVDKEQQDAEEAFEQGFHGIPHPNERAKMSPEKLAIALSNLEKESPPYILLEHELNLRLAKEQSKATLSSGWLGLIGSISASLFGVVLGYFIGTLSPKEMKQEPSAQAYRCECNHTVQGTVGVQKPLPSSTVMQGSKSVDVKPSGCKRQNEQTNVSIKP